MNSLGNVSKAGWLAAAILATVGLMPSAASATAAAVTEIIGSGGQRAAVTNAGQLTTTEAPPSAYEDGLESADAPTSSTCANLPVFSASAGFIVKELTIDAYDVSGPADTTAIAVFLGPGCGPTKGVDQVTPATDGITVLPISTGLAIPPKGTISFEVLDMGALVTAFGYRVPPNDAPGYSPTNSSVTALQR